MRFQGVPKCVHSGFRGSKILVFPQFRARGGGIHIPRLIRPFVTIEDQGTLMSRKRKPTTDAVETLHRRYFEGKPHPIAELEEARATSTWP